MGVIPIEPNVATTVQSIMTIESNHQRQTITTQLRSGTALVAAAVLRASSAGGLKNFVEPLDLDSLMRNPPRIT